jgi:hypothetical protein
MSVSHICKFLHTSALVVINSNQSTGKYLYVTGLSPSTSYYFRIFAKRY